MKKPRLNYIEQINNFWRKTLTHCFKPNDISLYFYLLHVNNSCNWIKSFSHNNRKIEASINISFKTLAAARVNLKKAGLIDFQTTNGSPNVDYKIITLSKFPEVKGEVLDEGSGEVWDEISKTKEKQNNIKRDDDDIYSNYIEKLGSDENEDWRKTIYDKYKLRNKSLKKIIDEFVLSLKTSLKPTHETYESFISHFVNWLNTQEKHNKLNSYKKDQKIGGI